jgi:hypothetical protein
LSRLVQVENTPLPWEKAGKRGKIGKWEAKGEINENREKLRQKGHDRSFKKTCR